MQKVELRKDIKDKVIEDIKKFFCEEREEELGNLAAEIILDFFIDEIGPYIYNQGIADAADFVGKKLEDIYEITI